MRKAIVYCCLLALCAAAAQASYVDLKWPVAFKSFFPAGTPGIEIQADNPEDSYHARAKRAIYAAFGWAITCQPGWTGVYCQTPICHNEPPFTRPGSLTDQLIDRVDLRGGCAEPYTFPLEAFSQRLAVTVSVSTGSPNITLLDQFNNIVPTTGYLTSTISEVIVEHPQSGLYTVSIQLDNSNSPTCYVTVYSESFLSLHAGFVETPFSDFVNEAVAYSGQPAYIVAHANNITNPGGLGAVFVRVNHDDRHEYVSSLAPRYGCHYEYFAGTYTCNVGGSIYQLLAEGTDQTGARFRRTLQFYCINRPVPPTTEAPFTPPPDSCLNGGTLVNTSQPPFCYCGEFFLGNDCSERVCMNGGNENQFGGCDCAAGYTGDFCQHVFCTDVVHTDFNTDKKTLAIVYRASAFLVSQSNLIAQAISNQIYYHIANGDNIYDNFILVTYGNNASTWDVFTSSAQLINAVQNLANSQINAAGCSDDAIEAVSDVFNEPVIAKSPIFLITDVPADDGADYLTIVHRNTFTKSPVFVLYVPNLSSSCSHSFMQPGFRALYLLAQNTGGLLLNVSQNDIPSTLQYTMRYVTHHRQLVFSQDLFQCSMNNYGSFFADSTTRNIAVLATGQDLILSLLSPDGNQTTFLDVVEQSNNNYLWTLDARHVRPGEFLFLLSSRTSATAPCSYRIYIESDYDLFIGVSDSLQSDIIFTEPIYNFASNIIATLNGLIDRVEDPFRLFAEVQINRVNGSGALEPVYYSSGTYRDMCNFHLYFGAFTCNQPHEHLYAVVFADDALGFTIQRTAIAYCAYEQPTESPPGTCQNGGVPNPFNQTHQTCLCPQNWGGQFCQDINCHNNGIPRGPFCECPPGTGGRFCEEVSCTNPATGISFGFTHRSLVFVLNTRAAMASSLQHIAQYTRRLVRDLFTTHNFFITEFSVIAYDDVHVHHIRSRGDAFSFVEAVELAYNLSTSPNASTACLGRMDTAITDAIRYSVPDSFIFVFTNSESNDSNIDYLLETMNAQDLKIQIHLVSTGDTLCGSTNNTVHFTDRHIALAGYTGGDVYYTTRPGHLLSIIPTFYQTGEISGGHSETCNITRYVPVDSWSQSFSIHTYGTGVTIQVTPPDNSSATLYATPIEQDVYTQVIQYVIPCDPVWNPNGVYCYYANPTGGNYQQVAFECSHNHGAHLIHIFGNDTQASVDQFAGNNAIWIGLTRVGNSTTFAWEEPPGANFNFTLQGYTNWDSSVNLNDLSAGNCVVNKPASSGIGNRWFVAQCNSTNAAVCQKHRYGLGSEPQADQNILPGGLWKVQLTGDGSVCTLRVRIQSEIQVIYGFVTDIHSDEPATYANLQTNTNRIVATVTGIYESGQNGDPTVGNLNYAYLYHDANFIGAVTLQRRTHCAYTSVSQNFTCPAAGGSAVISEMPIRFSGIDQFGRIFERIVTPYCSNTLSCLNGGYLYNGQCICPPFFEGSRCQNRVCQNDGTLEPNGECRCTEETGGEFCEHFNCVPPRAANFNDTGKTLAILIETSYNMGPAIAQFRYNFKGIVQNATNQANPNWFTNYILVPFDSFNNYQSWYPTVESSNIDDIVAALNNITLFACPNQVCPTGDNCPRPILGALFETLTNPAFQSPNSVVYILTQSSVEDTGLESQIINQIQRTRAKISVFVPDVTQPCGLPWTDYSNRILGSLAENSGGEFVAGFSRDIVYNAIPLLLPRQYQSNLIDGVASRSCNHVDLVVSIDSDTAALLLTFSGGSPVFTILDPQNNTVAVPPNAITSQFNYIGVINTYQKPGTYRIIAATSNHHGFCLINIHAFSTIEVFDGYVLANDVYHGATNDDAHWAAIADPTLTNTVIIHANNLHGGTINYVQLYSTGGVGGERPHVFTSEVKRRSERCSYEYYSVDSFSCSNLGIYVLVIYGIDNRGFNFQRVQTLHCLADRPPRPPTPPTCDLHDRVFDIVAIIDGSQGSDFNSLKNILATTFSPFTLNANYTRISPIVINYNATLGGQLIDSDGKTATQVFSSLTTDSSNGQNLEGGLNLAVLEHLSASSGYRTDSHVRHLIVYLTQNVNITGGDALNTINALKRGGFFGFISVGHNIPQPNLLSVLGGEFCSYTGEGPQSAQLISNFIQDIACFNRPVCGEGAGSGTFPTGAPPTGGAPPFAVEAY